ncbi:unnamed protein product [Taenia asiatica]|uniref:Uncharacterized protein n=1 Tax=Taenia asiatica TaxID=60517 RepID=A0A3P6NRI2_TAEAS|nr:unnamed protein product [Taenia asiatica]
MVGKMSVEEKGEIAKPTNSITISFPSSKSSGKTKPPKKESKLAMHEVQATTGESCVLADAVAVSSPTAAAPINARKPRRRPKKK